MQPCVLDFDSHFHQPSLTLRSIGGLIAAQKTHRQGLCRAISTHPLQPRLCLLLLTASTPVDQLRRPLCRALARPQRCSKGTVCFFFFLRTRKCASDFAALSRLSQPEADFCPPPSNFLRNSPLLFPVAHVLTRSAACFFPPPLHDSPRELSPRVELRPRWT